MSVKSHVTCKVDQIEVRTDRVFRSGCFVSNDLSSHEFSLGLIMRFLFLNRSINFCWTSVVLQYKFYLLILLLEIHCRWQSRQLAGVEAPARRTLPSVDAADVRWRTQPSTRSAASATSASIQPSRASFRSSLDKEWCRAAKRLTRQQERAWMICIYRAAKQL